MRLIHLSDIHFSKENIENFKLLFEEPFLNDLKSFHKDIPIDFIVVSGDLIDKGGVSFNGDNAYEIFENEFINPICTAIGLDNQNFIFIPGNHDVNTNNIDEYYESGLQSNLNTIEKVNEFIKKNADPTKQGIARMKEFHTFKRKYYSDSENNSLSCFSAAFIREKSGKKIGFAAINSAWRCSPSLPKDKLMVGTSQIFNLDKLLKEKQCDFNIAIMHHPIDLINEIERHEIKNALHEKDFDILLTGHTHESSVSNKFGPNGNIFYSTSRAAFNNPREEIDKFKSGYVVIDIDLDTLATTTHFRKYIHSRFVFDKDLELAEEGYFKSNLAQKATKKEFHDLILIKNRTCDLFKEDVNHSLLTFGTDSIAPKELTKLFVLPLITDSPETLGDIDEERKKYNLDDLLTSPNNLLLIGEKESGKSTLLNRLFIEVANDFPRYQRIPVLLNFKSFENKDVVRLIRDFIHESSESVKSLCDESKILVFLDDFEPFNGFQHSINKVKRFIKEYPKVKIISTSCSSFELFLSQEPTLFSHNPDFQNPFKPLFIGNVGVNEFKGLAKNWFKDNNSEWLVDNIGRLIKVFEALRIPRTFFSVSIYLWIIEKQEKFNPINKFELVKRFINHILEGLKIDDTKAGSYGYNKKIELLTELALSMYQNGDNHNSYALKESSVIKVFEDNFTLNQLKFSPIEKLQEFIEKGVICKVNSEESVYYFRFNAFFSYFLSFNIDKNSDFKSHVFSDEYFLSFIDELDYYSGSKRDDKNALIFAMDKVKCAFENIDKIISDNFDSFIPKKSIFLKHIDTNDLIKEAKNSKLSDDEIEEVLEGQMQLLPVDKSIKIKEETKDFKSQFSKALELAAKVLKNSENIKDPDLVNQSLDIIIKKSAKYGFYINSLIIREIEKNPDDFPLPPEMLFFMAPIINQLMLLGWLGTDFLEVPINKKIHKHLSSNNESEYELYLTAFLFADMKFQNHINILKSAIDKIDNKFILELCFLKIFLYYMMRPEGSSLLEPYEELMKKIIIKARGFSKEGANKLIESGIRSKKFGDNQFPDAS
ncbi:MAG: metallophosphoesterase [Candidatus Delongbacteria bacterium]|nr:metallophosphoesterase [Candidatus Delongbacteria bacterium]